LFGYPFVVYSGIAIGIMAFGVWAHHMFAVGLGPIADAVFAINTMLIAVPTGVKIFNWIGTIWGGHLRMTTAMYFALSFIAMFIIGGLSGVMHASPPADLQQSDTYFIVAHIHYVLMGGAMLGIFAGIYYWFPKITGRLLGEGLGKLHFWLFFIGLNTTFFPMHFLGLDGMPRRIYTYPAGMGWELWNFVATVGVFILGLSILVFLWNVFASVRTGARAGNDPWDGQSLEWSIPSPPPEYNFAAIPSVHSRRPFWDEKYGAEGSEHGAPAPIRGGAHAPAGTQHAIHMPDPSYWPIWVAVGIGLAAAGLIFPIVRIGGFLPVLSVIGIVITIIGIYGWSFEPPAASDAHQAPSAAEHTEETTTGLNHRKMLMWAFLGSECMFFGTLIGTYMVYRGRSITGPYPSEVLDIPFTSLSAFVLLLSSFAMVLALAATQRGDQRGLRVWLLATALMGMIFLGGQYYEFTTFVHEGLSLQQNLFGATFFVLTGFHGGHVTIGVIWLLSLFVLAMRGKLSQRDSLNVELAGLYWHFVDIVWILIFTLVYLIPS
ncbi:MAG: cbb3-type cytochrome c oxidase subunit I, partial [Chloroflexi bacterium]|nr:cbb3-type cytochrome c oxidase subunit I [Chloroflexota bacterium]